ncbi:MAG: FkbM family methyltransferase [bacterium]
MPRNTEKCSKDICEIDPKRCENFYKNPDIFCAAKEPRINFIVKKQQSITQKCLEILSDMPKGSICIDCGSLAGYVTELFYLFGAKVYAFEANSRLANHQKDLFKTTPQIEIFDKAVWDKNTTLTLSSLCFDGIEDISGSSITLIDNTEVYKQDILQENVEVIDLTEFIEKEILPKRIYILKLDVEGAEFEILEKIILKGLYNHIDYIFCETHERFFQNGEQRMAHIKNLIEKNNIKNIYLDWM